MSSTFIQIYFNNDKELSKKLEDYEANYKCIHVANKENEQLKQVDNRNNIEFYKQELRKRDEHIRDLEALDNADNIELQFYKDEVKLVILFLTNFFMNFSIGRFKNCFIIL